MPRKRKLPTGMIQRGAVYHACFRSKGRLIRKRLSTNFEAAREMLNELRSRADRGDFGMMDNDYLIVDLERRWLRYCSQKCRPRTAKRYRQHMAHIKRLIVCKRVNQLDVETITAYREDRLREPIRPKSDRLVTPQNVNKEVNALKNMLNWGLKHKLIGSNPIRDVEDLPADEPFKNRRTLSVGEIERIFEASPPRLKPVWRMFMVTGIRHDELVSMKFADVDFEGRVVTVRSQTAKNHRSRDIPLDDDILAVITQLKREAACRQPVSTGPPRVAKQQVANFSREHVFVTGANTPWKNHLLDRFYEVCEVAGIEGAHSGGTVDIHALRVSYITLALEHGAPLKGVQENVGHATARMTMDVYAKATAKAQRAAISVLPFASASAPEHIIPVQNVHKSAQTPTGGGLKVVG